MKTEVRTKAGHLEPLVGKAEVIATLGVSTRHLERMVSKGEFPQADMRLGRLVRWKASTVAAWVEAGGTGGIGR